MRVADYVIARLHEAGIDHAFTVSGGGSIFIGDALDRGPMRYVACHHEQAAAMAAEGYARVRTGLGLAVVTSGPGGTNAITGVAGAWTDHVPTVTISGQAFSGQTIGDSGLRTKGVQELDIVSGVKPYTKYAVMVTEPDSIRFHLEQALYLAQEGRPGPVWLDIPADVQKADVEPSALRGFVPGDCQRKAVHDAVRAAGERQLAKDVAAVVGLLQGARRPLLHVGQGVRLAGAQDAFLRFAEAAGIPVLTARNGNDLIDSGHPLYIGRPGTFAQRGANFAVQTCDVYLAIGTRLSLAQTGYNAKDYARGAKVVMVDIDRAELGKGTVNIHLGIQADAGDFLRALPLTGWPDWSGWLARCKGWQARYPVVLPEYRERQVNSYVLADTLSALAGPEHVIVTDMGYSFQTTHQTWQVKQGQRLFTNCGLASMGWGLPAAIGASFGSDRPVIAIVGDGGLMMNIQELATLSFHKRNVKLFVLNNGGYLTQSKAQRFAFDRTMGSGSESLCFPDFRKVAEAFGLTYKRIEHADAVRLPTIADSDGPVFIEVMMDAEQEQAPRSLNRRLPDGSFQPTAIEDAWPFLDPKEIQENIAMGLSI